MNSSKSEKEMKESQEGEEERSAHDVKKTSKNAFLRMIRPVLYIDSTIYFLIGIQLFLIPLFNGVIFINQGFFIFLFFLFDIISYLLGKNYDRWPNVLFNNIWLLVNIVVPTAIYLFFSGPLTPLINVLSIILIVLNAGAFLLNFGIIVFRSLHMNLNNYQILQKPKKEQLYSLLFLCAIIISGIGSYMSWGKIYKIKADDDFTTTSSYWGPPRDDSTTVIRKITPVDTNTLHVHNSSLNESVEHFMNDSFCYAEYVYYGSGDTEYCNYSSGAISYPNGTIYLSQSLPALDDVEIKFTYRYDIGVFQDLRTSNSTLIMNYLNSEDDFVEFPNIFERIEETYLLQLLDWWDIKYYLDIGIRELKFPHIFNYPPFVERSNQTLEWAASATIGEDGPKALTNMVGISLDFESSDKDVKAFNPLQNWDLKPEGLIPYGEWIGSNEQNRTLYKESVEAYENVYTKCSDLGFKFYAVFQGNAMMDIMDGDLDTTRLPTYPISPNEDVLYGIMAYQDSNFEVGRYRIYKSCKNQIELYGEQGETILLGWLSHGAEYYTNDSIGLERYIHDCKIAQAAGIKEIFHAPLYRMQGTWGNEAILRLHQELNEEEKEAIKVHAPSKWNYDGDLMNDYIQNFDKLYFFIPLMFVIVGFFVREIIRIRKGQ